MIKFQSRGKETQLISKTITAFESVSEHEQRNLIDVQSESKKAQYLAEKIEDHLEGCSDKKRYIIWSVGLLSF